VQITEGDPNAVTFTPGPASRFKWEASGSNPCPRCQELDGDIRTLESWESSVMPGLHKHCQCKLVCVEEVDSGWMFANQFPELGFIFFNIDGSISHDPTNPAPHHPGSSPNPDLPEGSNDIIPYEPPPHGPNTSPNPELPPPYVPPPYHYDH
jgi:hypothetical protein